MTTIDGLIEHFRQELARHPRDRLGAAEAEVRVALKRIDTPPVPRRLARYYGTLALTHGERTTALDVQRATAAWRLAKEPYLRDRELVLFDLLPLATRRDYEQRAEAIRHAASRLRPRARLFVLVCRVVMALVWALSLIPWFTGMSGTARWFGTAAFLFAWSGALCLREHRARGFVAGCIVAPLFTVTALLVR